MANKLLISSFTWRPLEMQREAFPDMPSYIAPDDFPSLFRKTTRQGVDRIHVLSLAIIAETEKRFREFLDLAIVRKCVIISKEEGREFELKKGQVITSIIKEWKLARNRGASKIGARISANNKMAITKIAIEKIKDRWPMPSDTWPTKTLLEEAEISLNTAKAHLGNRPIAQHNYRAKHSKQIKQLELNPAPREKVDFCGVYIFQIEEGVYKVGSSNHSDRRFKQVSQHHKKQMKVVETFNMDINKAFAVESEAHYLLRKHIACEYNGREIFKASLNVVKKAINKAIKNVLEAPKYE